MAAVCVGRPAYSWRGNHSTGFWRKQMCHRRAVSLSKTDIVCP